MVCHRCHSTTVNISHNAIIRSKSVLISELENSNDCTGCIVCELHCLFQEIIIDARFALVLLFIISFK